MKTRQEIMEQLYMSASDLKTLIPELGIDRCRTYINNARTEMESLNYFVPRGKKKLALTSILKKKFGWK